MLHFLRESKVDLSHELDLALMYVSAKACHDMALLWLSDVSLSLLD